MVEYHDGAEILAQRPNPVFEPILKGGYRLVYAIEEDSPSIKDVHVLVRFGEQVVAEGLFHADEDDPLGIYCQNIRVEPEHRRQGLANGVCCFAERLLGRPMYNFWKNSPIQSRAARAMWDQPDRPFGIPGSIP